jgi:hypothetical protein
MKKVLCLAGLLAVVFVALGGIPFPVAEAAQTCSTTCSSGRTLTCTTASGTCTSVAGSVSCCGTTHYCSTIDAAAAARTACVNECWDDYDACADDCTVRHPCLSDCGDARFYCMSQCPPFAPTSFSC